MRSAFAWRQLSWCSYESWRSTTRRTHCSAQGAQYVRGCLTASTDQCTALLKRKVLSKRLITEGSATHTQFVIVELSIPAKPPGSVTPTAVVLLQIRVTRACSWLSQR